MQEEKSLNLGLLQKWNVCKKHNWTETDWIKIESHDPLFWFFRISVGRETIRSAHEQN